MAPLALFNRSQVAFKLLTTWTTDGMQVADYGNTGNMPDSGGSVTAYLDQEGVCSAVDGAECATRHARVGLPRLEGHAPGGLQRLRGCVASSVRCAYMEAPVPCSLSHTGVNVPAHTWFPL